MVTTAASAAGEKAASTVAEKIVSCVVEEAVPFVWKKSRPLLLELYDVVRCVPKEVADINKELDRIQTFINDAERMDAAKQDNEGEEVKTRVKQLKEAIFRIEEVIDEYMIFKEQQQPRDPGCEAFLCDKLDFLKTLIPRVRIACGIEDIKSGVRKAYGIKDMNGRRTGDGFDFQTQSSSEQGSSSSAGSQNDRSHALRQNVTYVGEVEVVGFGDARDKLIRWLEEERAVRTVICVVGEGGSGKTTLAKAIYQENNGKFDCHARITVSQSCTVEDLLRTVLGRFYEDEIENHANRIPEMDRGSLIEDFWKKKRDVQNYLNSIDRGSLIEEVGKYLREKRYLVLFDDVWGENFWNDIRFAFPDNKKRSRILITTRKGDVAKFCKQYSFVHIHEMERLSIEESLELFRNNAFRQEHDGHCPKGHKHITSKIVEKCKGLPLAIVAAGGYCARENPTEWQKLYDSLSSEQEKNSTSTGITKILSLSFDDLPYCLKSCFLYFGIYPEDHEVESTKLIEQWIAEGFVRDERGKTLQQVAEQYLGELIQRNLVQVNSFSFDGEIKKCHVHDLLRELILKKIEDLSFCHFVSGDNQSIFSGMIQRLKISTYSNNLMATMESSHIRSLYVYKGKGNGKELPEDFVKVIPTKYKLLKVLDFENAPLNYVSENLGNLIRLRYLSLRKTGVKELPKSIGDLQFLETLDLGETRVREMPKEIYMLRKLRYLSLRKTEVHELAKSIGDLQFLETLDLRGTRVREMPKEINMLEKLRHLLANHTSWGYGNGIQMKEGIGSLKALQTLRQVEIDYRGVELIEELKELTQLRSLGLINVKKDYGTALRSSIKEMKQLKTLYIDPKDYDGIIDVHHISALHTLQKLRLRGKLESDTSKGLPEWIPKLQNLVKLSLISSKLSDDPLKSLKDMQNLLFLSLDYAYEGESLHFQDRSFQKLKKLSLRHLYSLSSIIVGEEALPLLKEFRLEYIPQLHEVPNGINQLGKLEVFHIINMPQEFRENIQEEPWINKHVRQVNITDSVRSIMP